MRKPRPRGFKTKTDRCPYGHPYDGYIHSDGKRRCRRCMELSRKAWEMRQVALAAALKEKNL